MTVQESFEAWAKKRGCCLDKRDISNGSLLKNPYRAPITKLMYDAWCQSRTSVKAVTSFCDVGPNGGLVKIDYGILENLIQAINHEDAKFGEGSEGFCVNICLTPRSLR